MSSANFVKKMLNNQKSEVKPSGYTSKNEDWKFSVGRVMMTGVLKNQYYRSADEAAKEALPLLLDGARKDPLYVLRAACFARDAHMKGMVKVGLAAVAGQASDDFLVREDVRDCAIGLLSTFHPGQLIQFVELMKSKACGRGFGARPQKWVAEVMQNWREDKLEEYTLKYPKDLNALLRLVHPQLDNVTGAIARYVLTSLGPKSKNGKAHGTKQKSVEYLKLHANDTKLVAKTILEDGIPWDVIKGFATMDKNVWTACMTQMGLSALLLNLKSLDEHSVFDTKDGLHALSLKLQEVQEGRSLPIDFAKPYIHCVNAKVRDLLLDAMVNVLRVDMPALQGKKVGVTVDISGSMTGETLQTAGLLSVPFLKSNLWFTTFDTELWEEGSSSRNNSYYSSSVEQLCPKIKGLEPKQQIKNLLSLRTRGGTDVAVALKEAINSRRVLDVMVIITDEQQNAGTPLMTVWKNYKKTVNPRAELFVINATNTPWHAADFGDASVTVYQSMTPAIFKNLQFVGQDLVSAIENYELKTVLNRREQSAKVTPKKEVNVVVPSKVRSSSKFVNQVLKPRKRVAEARVTNSRSKVSTKKKVVSKKSAKKRTSR